MSIFLPEPSPDRELHSVRLISTARQFNANSCHWHGWIPPSRTALASVVQNATLLRFTAGNAGLDMTLPNALLPRDEHNQRLESLVCPPNWTNPPPTGRYNLVVIGAGTAGLVTAAGAAGLGAKVALIERALMGGDCLNVGCVPSKSLISASRAVAAVRDAARFGVRVPAGTTVDFPAVMERLRRTRAAMAPHDSAERFRSLGVDVYLGEARFVSAGAVEVGRARLDFKHAAICTGARPAIPPIPGLESIDCLTNESVFSLTELPRRMAVIGAGPIGCELAQAFSRFGATVWLIDTQHGVLPREERDCADIVRQAMERDGVRVLCCGQSMQVTRGEHGTGISLNSHGQQHELQVDRVLVAAGRTPNVDGLNLEAAGVTFDRQAGVSVNDRLQTSNPAIYAAGDVCSSHKFTHAADFMARVVIQNSLFLGRKQVSALTIPWCTYTSPEIARVGLSSAEAEQRGIGVDTFTQPFQTLDRAILDSETDGLVRIHVAKRTDRIVGATIVAAHAGDLISEVALAMTNGIGLGRIASTIHPYPTQADAIRKLGDAYSRTRLTPTIKAWLSRWLAWTR